MDKREESQANWYQRLVNKFEMEGFIVEPCQRKDPEGKRGVAEGRGVMTLRE